MRLKELPEDFIVREDIELSLSQGMHSVYLLRKRDWNTEDCLQWLVEKKNIPRKNIGVCGNKDRQAVTEQYITIKNGGKELSTPPGWTLTYLGTRIDPLRMGDHANNFFTITVKELPASAFVNETPVLNLYGEQRFGKDNLEVGFALLRKDYAKACELLNLPKNSNPIGELRKIPRHTLLIYVHAVQSLLWNEVVNQLPRTQVEVPIIGYGPSGELGLLPLYEPIMEKYNLTYDAWINKSFPELSQEGGCRPLLQDLQHFSASTIANGECTVCFSLGKGSYATETVKQVFSENL